VKLNTLGNVGLALLWLFSHASFADAEVQVEADAGVIRVSAQIATSVDRKTAWGVLSDYNHWAEFIPDMIVSRIVSQPGEPLLLEQRGTIPCLSAFPLVVIAQVEETPYTGLRFRGVAGNIKALAGEWRIQGKHHVRLIYHSTVEPGFPLPTQVSIELFRNDARIKLEALAQEMARRAEANR
jgi:Polyketide cyclase / dehydrase and lipid transport